MDADDPRHGQNKGYVAGCRELCCRRAHMVDMKRYRINGRRLLIPATGTHRRIQALIAIGWPSSQIADRLGHRRDYILKLLKHNEVQACTHTAVAALYERLSMQIPEDGPGTNSAHLRARLLAARNGWAPPLAWDDIDNDPAPHPHRETPRGHNDYDEAVVLRMLAGEHLHATNAERHAIVARWQGPLADIERRFGWKPERYRDGAA